MPTDEKDATILELQATLEVVLDTIQDNPHVWTTAKCPTCIALSGLVGRPFGCVLVAKAADEAEKQEKGGGGC